VFDFEPPWVTAYRFHLVVGSFMLLVFVKLVIVAIMPRGFLYGWFLFHGFAFVSSLLFFGENCKGYALCGLGVIYWPVRNLCSSIHNLSYLV
jgi:hypothetical protein